MGNFLSCCRHIQCTRIASVATGSSETRETATVSPSDPNGPQDAELCDSKTNGNKSKGVPSVIISDDGNGVEVVRSTSPHKGDIEWANEW